MIISIITNCYVGEFDQAEFPHYTSHKTLDNGSIEVLETIELDERSVIQIEA